MKNKNIALAASSTLLIIVSASLLLQCKPATRIASYPTDTIYTNQNNTGATIELSFKRGNTHNHPLMAIWTTDTNNKYIESIYVAESIAKGVFGHGDKTTGKWLPGAVRRPAALPVWAYSRNVKEADGLYIPTENTAMVDAVTGATPQNNFVLKSKLTSNYPNTYHVYFEINQTWDWNKHWTNNKYPDDENYKTSCQPSLVYRATISSKNNYTFELIGHGHYNGSDGNINPDLSTITSARNITDKIWVKIID